jgi:hypothetical protein
VGVAFREQLSGGVSAPGEPLSARPMELDLALRGRGLIELALGAPLAVSGRVRGPGRDAPGAVPREGVVWGTARLLATRGFFYDLRLAEEDGAPPSAIVSLAGGRRFVRGDLWASATTLDAELRRGGAVVGAARLRFDARDDLPRLLGSIRLGPTA